MNEKTLRQVGSEAKQYYITHRVRANMLENAKDAKSKADGSHWHTVTTANSQELAQEITQVGLDSEMAHYDKNSMGGADFANDNAEQLHDLAVLEAHIGGIAINVEQPVVAGQRIAVHVSH